MRPEQPLKIGVASLTRFHMFDLAREMGRLRQRVTLFSGYPAFKVDDDLRPFARTRPWWLLASRLRAMVPPAPRANRWNNLAFEDFGRWMRRQVSRLGLDVLDALDGTGLEAGRWMRDHGGTWICNRGSAHVLTQKELLEEEFTRWGEKLPASAFDPQAVSRCVAEYEEADAVVVPSQFARRSFLERGFAPGRVHVCPYGVDLSMFRPEPKQDDKFRVLFVGAQSIQKGIGYLFDAVRPLVRAGAAEVWLVGTATPDAEKILARNADLFTAHCSQPRDRLSWYYSQASVLVLPSIQEGLALVQAQAMACGVPVIASAHTGGEDLFTDGVEGFIVPVRDPAAIRAALLWMLENPRGRETMAEAALQRVRTLGGWREYGQRCLNMYHAVRFGAVATANEA
ncbi:MAG TPA: glycosyltransferase family 4 protein [Bryobacteraceae bacterium]|nr:glycosyltransferase family 4 protein [Bryobacteraceae bacterium]